MNDATSGRRSSSTSSFAAQASSSNRGSPLDGPSGRALRLDFDLPAATSAEIMGDVTSWEPVPLEALDVDIDEIVIRPVAQASATDVVRSDG